MGDSSHDYFSKQAATYAAYRPGYTEALFSFLATVAPGRRWALDCATGSGQAAEGLANIFERVIAIDVSIAQLSAAVAQPNISYIAAQSESLPVKTATMDLVTVAQAMHWFKLDEFYREVNRILKPGGTFAAWSYGLLTIDEQVDDAIRAYHDEILGLYWPAERWLVLDGYASLPFPFKNTETRTFDMEAHWSLDELFGFLRTWSATQRYIDEHDRNPVEQIVSRLASAWGTRDSIKSVRWPLSLRYGYRQDEV